MNQMFLKEMREQTGVILMGIYLAFAIILIFRIKMPDITQPTDLLEHSRLLEISFLLMFVVYAAAFSNALAGDRDRGHRLFSTSLPIHPVSIWLAKILSACCAIIIVHVAIAMLGWLFGFPDLTMFATLIGLPKPMVYVMILSIISALMCGALFHRAFSVLIASILLIFTLAMMTSFIQLLWNWQTLMEWPMFVMLAAVLLLSLATFIAETRHRNATRKTAWFAAVGILLLSGLTLSAQYIHDTCQTPNPDHSRFLYYIPASNTLLAMSDATGPLYQLGLDGQSLKQIGRRFETTHRNAVSADGRFLVLFSNRGFGGSLKRGILDFENETRGIPLKPIREWIDGEQPDEYGVFWGIGETIFIVDLKTGERTPILSNDLGEPFQAVWYDHSDAIAVSYLKRGSASGQPQTSLALVASDGSIIRKFPGNPDDSFFKIGDDGSTIIRYKIMEFSQNNPPRIRTSSKTVLSDEWSDLEQWYAIPSVSPDHKWIMEYFPASDSDRQTMQIRSKDGVSISAGETANWELRAWSPSGTRLLYTHNPDNSGRKLMMFETSGTTINALPESLNTVFDDQFAPWARRVIFSPLETRVAFCGHTPDATLILYNTERSEETRLISHAYPVGWLDNDNLLIKHETTLSILNAETGIERSFPVAQS